MAASAEVRHSLGGVLCAGAARDSGASTLRLGVAGRGLRVRAALGHVMAGAGPLGKPRLAAGGRLPQCSASCGTGPWLDPHQPHQDGVRTRCPASHIQGVALSGFETSGRPCWHDHKLCGGTLLDTRAAGSRETGPPRECQHRQAAHEAAAAPGARWAVLTLAGVCERADARCARRKCRCKSPVYELRPEHAGCRPTAGARKRACAHAAQLEYCV